jgi:hypothetical protein
MPTLIDQMQVQMSDTPQDQPKPPAVAPPRLDPEAIECVVRRALERRARLATD